LIDRKTGNLSENICIPLFSDYLLICKTYKKHAVIELKGLLANENIDDVAAIIHAMGMTEKVSIISFNDKYLLYVKKNYPEFDLYFLASELNDKVLEFCEKNQLNLDVKFDILDEASIKRLHLVGLKVNVWTVDDKETAEKLIKMGVDYITSNILE
jgi:glycerophosphoryl diester phosphodiesterase